MKVDILEKRRDKDGGDEEVLIGVRVMVRSRKRYQVGRLKEGQEKERKRRQ